MKRLSIAFALSLAVAATPCLAQDAELPQGHPSTGAAAGPATPEQDANFSDPKVPPGSIQVRLVDAEGKPLANSEVTLVVQFQKISEGDQKSERHAKTDAEGVANFSGLATGSDYNYRAMTRSGPAEYASEPIQLRNDSGIVAALHVYPVTRRVEEASIGGIVFVYVETRDDVFQFEVLARYGNRSTKSWVPESATMRLPSGFKAFKAGEAMSDVRFEEDPGRGVKLLGTFSPGQKQASFRFQVPRHEESSSSFHFGLLPHVGEARFIAEAAPSMELDVDGFEKPQSDVSQTGQRVLVTRRVAVRGESRGLDGFTAQLSGIPTPGNGRWIAALIAAALGALGFAAFRGKIGSETQADLQDRDAERAQRVLLDEIVDLTRARKEERVGPGTYESARRTLVEALARIVSQNPELGKRARRTGKKPKKSASA